LGTPLILASVGCRAGKAAVVIGRNEDLSKVLLEFKILPAANQYTDLEMLPRFLLKGLWGMFY